MDKMKKLEVLSLSHNKLRKLPQSIYDIESRQNLDIDENDFADSPSPTLEQQSFQDYLELEEYIDHLGSAGLKEGDEIEFVNSHKKYKTVHTDETRRRTKI